MDKTCEFCRPDNPATHLVGGAAVCAKHKEQALDIARELAVTELRLRSDNNLPKALLLMRHVATEAALEEMAGADA